MYIYIGYAFVMLSYLSQDPRDTHQVPFWISRCSRNGKSSLSTKVPWWIDIPMGVTRHLQISPKIRDLKLWECLNRPNVSITFHCSRAMNESGHSIPTKPPVHGWSAILQIHWVIVKTPRSYAWTWPRTFNIIGLLLQVRTPGEAKWLGLGG